MGGRIIELPLIPSSPRYPRVKRGKRSAEETARERERERQSRWHGSEGRDRGRGGIRMVARGSCAAAAAVGWEPGERNRRDDNICIIFNARTSGLRGGRQPPPADLFSFFLVFVSFGLFSRSLGHPPSPSLPPSTHPASLTTALLRRYPLTPLPVPFPRYSLATLRVIYH